VGRYPANQVYLVWLGGRWGTRRARLPRWGAVGWGRTTPAWTHPPWATGGGRCRKVGQGAGGAASSIDGGTGPRTASGGEPDARHPPRLLPAAVPRLHRFCHCLRTTCDLCAQRGVALHGAQRRATEGHTRCGLPPTQRHGTPRSGKRAGGQSHDGGEDWVLLSADECCNAEEVRGRHGEATRGLRMAISSGGERQGRPPE
jgi:hypothetical protein